MQFKRNSDSLRKQPTSLHRDATTIFFFREMKSEERAQKFHTDDALLPQI